MSIDNLQVWFDTEVGHGICPEDETIKNCKYNELNTIVTKYSAEAYKRGYIDGGVQQINKEHSEVTK